MFYGLHERIDEPSDDKADIIRKNLESHIDVCLVLCFVFSNLKNKFFYLCIIYNLQNNIESSREELDTVDSTEAGIMRSSFPFNAVRAQSTSCLDLSSSQTSEKARLEKNGHKSM